MKGVIPMSEEKMKQELNEKELEQVVGGSFYDRGHTWSSDYPHRMIVTALYGCSLHRGARLLFNDAEGVCKTCKYKVSDGPVLYCTKRTHDDDPVEHYFHGSDYASGRF